MRLVFFLALALLAPLPQLQPHALAQLATRGDSAAQSTSPTPRRTRLILKDGTYQLVMSYKVTGSRVQFVSAERGGEVEEIPLELVDLDATKKWEQRHAPGASVSTSDSPRNDPTPSPVLDPELAREEADRAALSPEVATNLRLAPEDAILALDTFRGTPELVPLQQSEGDLNRQTGHSVLRGIIKPNSSQHPILELKGEKAAVQMHVKDPEFFLRLDDGVLAGGQAITVDTGGASSSPALKDPQKAPSRYAIVRVDVRQGARVVASFATDPNPSRRQEDVVPATFAPLPGGHWARLTPTEPLLFGEYCLIEILADHQVNLSVWDFGVHPTEPENRDVLRPEKPRTPSLEHRN